MCSMTFVVTLPTQRRIRCMKHPCGTPHPPGVPLLRCRQLIVNVNIAFWESRVKEKLGKMERVARRVWIYFAAGFGPAGPAGRLSPERREDRGSGSAIASEYAVSNEIRVPPIHAYNCLSTICCSHAGCGDIAWRAGRASPGDTATPVSFVSKAPFFSLDGRRWIAYRAAVLDRLDPRCGGRQYTSGPAWQELVATLPRHVSNTAFTAGVFSPGGRRR
jgi:hypothetical protein